MFYFHPYLGKIPILTNIFQMGWNHQLVKDLFLWWCLCACSKIVNHHLGWVVLGGNFKDFYYRCCFLQSGEDSQIVSLWAGKWSKDWWKPLFMWCNHSREHLASGSFSTVFVCKWFRETPLPLPVTVESEWMKWEAILVGAWFLLAMNLQHTIKFQFCAEVFPQKKRKKHRRTTCLFIGINKLGSFPRMQSSPPGWHS